MNTPIRQAPRLSNPVHFLALGFGSGLSPKMPGTMGTLVALPLVWLLSSTLSLPSFIALTLIVSVVGIWLCGVTADDMGVHDDAAIVWDEFAGMMITMLAVPLSWQTLLAGFALFRLFDILKPWPISYLDRHLHGGLGIMLDDILAGVFAMLCLHGLVFMGWVA